MNDEKHLDQLDLSIEKVAKEYQNKVAIAVRSTANTLKAFGVPHYQVAKALEMDDTYFSDLMAGKYRFPAAKVVRLFNAVLLATQKYDPTAKVSVDQVKRLNGMIEGWYQVHKAWVQLASLVHQLFGMWTDEDHVAWPAPGKRIKEISKAMDTHSEVMAGFVHFRADLRRSFKDVENGAPFAKIALPQA